MLCEKGIHIKTLFHTIESIALSPDNSIFVINGLTIDDNKNETLNYEVYDLVKKKPILQYRLAKKVESLVFNY